jgi:hypothetical protein
MAAGSIFSFGVHARDHDVELREQVLVLIERPVVKDVDLDAGEQPERRQPLVELAYERKLLAQPVADSPRATVSRGE